MSVVLACKNGCTLMHTVTTTKEKAPTKKSTAENGSTDVGVYLTTVEAAKYLNLSRQFLEAARYRADGTGPPYIKLERAVRYRRSALDAWMTAHEHSPERPLVVATGRLANGLPR